MISEKRGSLEEWFAQEGGDPRRLQDALYELCREIRSCGSDRTELETIHHDLQGRTEHSENRLFEFKDVIASLDESDPLWKLFCERHEALVQLNSGLRDAQEKIRELGV